ncbi:MAG: formate dehydrogenase subunit gamma [Nevskia sp.]
MASNKAERRVIPIRIEERSSLSASDTAAVQAVLAAAKDLPGALLPVLHGVQQALGHVPKDAVPLIAKALNLSRAEVHGVVSFYHWYRTEKPGAHVIHLCRAEACQSMGAAALEAHARQTLGVDFHGTTADRQFTLEPAYCLGNCALSPALLIDNRLHGRVTPQRFDTLVAKTMAAAS